MHIFAPVCRRRRLNSQILFRPILGVDHLTVPPSLNLNQPVREPSHAQSNIPSSLSNVHPSSSSSNCTKPGSHHRPHSPPPALKDAWNYDDERHDPDHLPISNVEEEDQEFLVDIAHVMQAFVVELDPGLLLPLLDRPITLQTKHPSGSSFAIAGGSDGVGSGSPSMTIEVNEPDADADADPEVDAEGGSEEAEAEILGVMAATSRNRTDGEEEGGDAELLEAVDAAEANSISSSHGGERTRMKSES